MAWTSGVGMTGLPVGRPGRRSLGGRKSVARARARLTGIALLALIALFVAACGAGPTPTPSAHTITGTFTLRQDEVIDRSHDDCRGRGGYDDVAPGLGVTVKNETGVIIGTGALVGTGRVAYGATKCEYTFTVAGLPEANFYSIEVGRRGELTYSRAEIEAKTWHIEFSLGE